MKWFAQHLRKSTSDLSKYLEWIIANLHLCASQFKLKAFSFVFRFSFPLPGNFSLEVDEESLDVEHEKSTFIVSSFFMSREEEETDDVEIQRDSLIKKFCWISNVYLWAYAGSRNMCCYLHFEFDGNVSYKNILKDEYMIATTSS